MRTRNALALGAAAALAAAAVAGGPAAPAAGPTTSRAVLGPALATPASFVRRIVPAENGLPAGERSVAGSGLTTGERPVAENKPPVEERPAERAPTCGKASDPDFPIDTRIHGGPTTVRAGSGFHTWSVELANGTDEACIRIHPVLVLTAQDPGLTADRVTVQFHDDKAGRWRPVLLEGTTEDELVGAFDDGFAGFTVPARGRITVRTRLSLAAGTAANNVTVNAAVVQRKGDDGDWVGESGDYRFAVVQGDGTGPARPSPTRSPGASPVDGESPRSALDQLATTGSAPLARVGVGAAVVLLSAGLLVLARRRRATLRRR